MAITKIKCPKCRGTGQLEYEKLNLFNFFTVTETRNCDACHGKGWIYD